MEYTPETFSISLLIKSAEITGEIAFDDGLPFIYDDLELLKAVEFVYNEQNLIKAKKGEQQSGAKYYKRVSKPGGGYRYFYTKKQYSAAMDEEKKQKKKVISFAYARYKKAVKEIDKDAEYIPMPGISGGKGILANKEKDIAYMVTSKGGIKGKNIKQVKLSDLRESLKKRKKSLGAIEQLENVYEKISGEAIDKMIKNGNEVKSIVVSDPAIKKGKEFRTFRVVKSPEHGQVIIDGKWKGYSLDDMITTQQRLRGGSGWMINPNTGRSVQRISLGEKKRRMVNVFHEPYITYEKGMAKIYIPKGDKYHKKLLMDIPGMNHLRTRGHIFKIGAHRILEVVNALGSASLSETMKGHADKQLNKRNNALLMQYFNPEELNELHNIKNEEKRYDKLQEKITSILESPDMKGYYKGADIKGMKKEMGSGATLKLRYTQAMALRRMVNEDNGAILGLDTGLGKTLASIAYHMKMKELGKYHEGSNGKMLIVSMNSNANTWKSEVDDFTEKSGEWTKDKNGVWENDNFVIMPQSRFNKLYGTRKPKKGEAEIELSKDKGKELKSFGSIVVDEPQEYMKNVGTRIFNTLVNLDHPRKVISSESVMTKNPGELINYMNISNNRHDPETRNNYEKEFMSNFESPEGGAKFTKNQDMEDAVRKTIRDNVIYYDKTEEPTLRFRDKEGGSPRMPKNRGEENATREPRVVNLPDSVKNEYNKRAGKILETLENMYKKYKDSKATLSVDDIKKAIKSNKIGGLAAIGQELNELRQFISKPENFIPQLKGINPKIERAAIDAKNHADRGRTSLVFSNGPEVAIKSAKKYSEIMGENRMTIAFTASSEGKKSKTDSVDPNSNELLKNNGKITIWSNGKKIGEYEVKKDMREAGLKMTEIMDKFKLENPDLTKGKSWGSIHATDNYNAGHNLQKVAHVIQHLDRDNWNPKVMYQRESRVIRPDNEGFVTHGTIHTYDIEQSEGMARSVDLLEKIRADRETALFDQIVKNSNQVKLEKPDIEEKTAKQIFQEKKARLVTKPDRTAILAGLGSQKDKVIHGQEIDTIHNQEVAQ